MNKKIYMLEAYTDEIYYVTIGKANSLKEFMLLAIEDLPVEIESIQFTSDHTIIYSKATKFGRYDAITSYENYWFSTREYKSKNLGYSTIIAE